MDNFFVDIGIKDLTLIKDLYFEFMDETHTGRPEDFNQSIKLFLENSLGFLTIIRDKKEIFGFVEYRILPKKLRDNKNIVEITSLFVKPQFRKNGFGVDLIDYVRRFAQQNDCYSIVLYSGLELVNAHKFYEKVGFIKSAYFFKKPVF